MVPVSGAHGGALDPYNILNQNISKSHFSPHGALYTTVALSLSRRRFPCGIALLGGHFGPEKKKFSSPPPPHRHSPGALPPPAPPPRYPPPLPLFLSKTGPPRPPPRTPPRHLLGRLLATSSDASSLSPTPKQNKNKIYPKRPPICSFLRVPAVFCGFLRKSAVFCGNLRFPNASFSWKRRDSAKISENQRKSAFRLGLSP